MNLFTIGHSNHSLETFLGLLGKHDVTTVVDVRTVPYSRYTPHFTGENLEAALTRDNMRYAFAGKYLGGRPPDPSCYRSRTLPDVRMDYLHLVDYPEVMKRDWFLRGIKRLLDLAEEQITCVLCSEEDPAQCHRHHLIARHIMISHPGVTVQHIRGDGAVLEAAAVPALRTKPAVVQASLF